MVGLAYEIDEILNESIMTGVPAVIVEGVDDISIYSALAKKSPINVEVYAVEYIDGFGEGCREVIRAVGELEILPKTSNDLRAYVLGVIDKDVRDFRNEIPLSPMILVLNCYSIENHFLSIESVRNILSLCTRISREAIDDGFCDTVMSAVKERVFFYYYHYLESLKKALDENYSAKFSYAFPPGRLKDEVLMGAIEGKKHELDDFAATLGLDKTMETMKSIGRGKWLIEIFSWEVFRCISKREGVCANDNIRKCPSCMAASYRKCLYKIKDGINSSTIKNLTLSVVDGSDFDYISHRISMLRPELYAQ